MDSSPAPKEPDPAVAEPSGERRSPDPIPAEPMLYCPACDQRLEQHKCKLVCNRCGYYMSCADYY